MNLKAITNYSKESIKNRMFKRAASLWEVRNIDNLDPLIKLMIEALASEIFRLSGEMNSMEQRILEKVSRALTPGQLLSARPAHAIMHARAIDDYCDLPNSTEFHYKDANYLKKHKIKRLAFTPIVPARVFNGDVAYIIDSEGCSAMDSKLGKDLIDRCTDQDPAMNHQLWIGLELAPEVKTLEGVSFYFDLPFIEDKEKYFKLLPFVTWQLAGQDITLQPGMFIPGGSSFNNPTALLEKYSAENQINENTLNLYAHRFLHLTDNIAVEEEALDFLPKEIAHLFEDDIELDADRPLLWLKASFPASFPPEVLKGLTAQINAFPIANKILQRTERKVEELSGMIPLQKGDNEFFLFVENVSDGHGNNYHEQKYKFEHGDTQNNLYVLRRGGCERFNSASAYEYLDRLVDLLRDESMAFANIEKDTLSEYAFNLIKQLNQLQEKVNSSDLNKEATSYIILNDELHGATSFFTEYWLTNALIGNNIKAHELLSFNDLDNIDRKTTLLLTTSRGGRAAPNSSELLTMYQSALTSHGAIYSKRDIKSFCALQVGHLLSDINVKQGYENSMLPKTGTVRTIDIHLQPSQELNIEQRCELKEDLLALLQVNSPPDFNYRIILEKPK